MKLFYVLQQTSANISSSSIYNVAMFMVVKYNGSKKW